MNTPEDRHASRRAGPPSRLAFVVCCALGAGCGDDGGGGGSGGTDTDSGGACVEDPVNLQLQSNPDFTGVIGGDKIGNYTKVAVGYVDESANASGCCQDYAMATASTSKVRIRFGIEPDRSVVPGGRRRDRHLAQQRRRPADARLGTWTGFAFAGAPGLGLVHSWAGSGHGWASPRSAP
jgi:hypothetical protein